MLIVLIASLVKGVAGFGFALVALPPLLFWYSPREIVPVLTLCNLIVSFFIVLQKKERRLVSKPFQRLIVFASIFTILGAMVLKYVHEEILIMGMSILFLLFLVYILFGGRLHLRITRSVYAVVGSLCGFLEGSISVSGPPLVLFLHQANVDNQEFREISSWFCLVTAVVAIISYSIIGLVTMQTITMTLFFLPMLYGGSYIGRRINQLLPSVVFKRMCLILTIISCVVVLYRMG